METRFPGSFRHCWSTAHGANSLNHWAFLCRTQSQRRIYREGLAERVSAIEKPTMTPLRIKCHEKYGVIDYGLSNTVYPNPIASKPPLGVDLGVEIWG